MANVDVLKPAGAEIAGAVTGGAAKAVESPASMLGNAAINTANAAGSRAGVEQIAGWGGGMFKVNGAVEAPKPPAPKIEIPSAPTQLGIDGSPVVKPPEAGTGGGNLPMPGKIEGGVISPDGQVVTKPAEAGVPSVDAAKPAAPEAGVAQPPNSGQKVEAGTAQSGSETAVNTTTAKPTETQQAQPLTDQESRTRQGEDWKVAHGEMTVQQRDQARSERASQAKLAEEDRQKAEHQQLRDMESTGKPMTPEQQNKLLEYNKQEQGRKTDFDQLKDRFEKGDQTLTSDEKARYEELRKEFNPEKPMTPEQMRQEMENLGLDILKGEGNMAEKIAKFQELKGKLTGEGSRYTEADAKTLVENILNPKEPTEAQAKLRENILRLMQIELQLVMMPDTVKQLQESLKQARSEASAEEGKQRNLMTLAEGDPQSKMDQRQVVYGKYMQIAQIKAQITQTRLSVSLLEAQHADALQYVRRKTGMSGPIDTVVSWASAKAGLAAAEMKYDFDIMTEDTLLEGALG